MSLLDIQLTLDTPLFSGSWRPDRIDAVTPLRPSTIKGIWRWWARAYATGILFDKGLIDERFTDRDTEKISQLIGSVIGLGYADPRGRTSRVSSYILELEAESKITPLRATRERSLNLQRITLLTLRRGTSVEYIERASFRLNIILRPGERPNIQREKAALGSLLTALILSGFGKGSRRGLGCVNVRIIGGSMADDYKLINLTNRESIKRLINETRRAFMELVKDDYGYRDKTKDKLPPLTLISDKIIDEESGLKAFQLYSLTSTSPNILNNLHNFFVRTRRQQTIGRDDLRHNLVGWILGLPREQRGTGYRIGDRNINRRASPFILSIHGDRVGYLSIFASNDWPKYIRWIGGRQKRRHTSR